MAKKKSESPEVELKPEETLHSILEEQHEEANLEDETVESPIKPEVETEEKPIEEPKEEPKTPEIDKEQIKRELREEVSKEVSDELVKKLKGDRETEDIPKTPWEKENRTPTWTEALEYAGEQAEKRLEEKQLAKAKAEEDARNAQNATNEDNAKKWNSYWDMQLDELASAGKIPKVADATSQEDRGIKARQQLFEAMVKVNTKRTAEGKPQITSVKEIYYEHYDPSKQPAGENAPVAGKTRSGNSQVSTSEYTAADRKKSFTQLLKEAAGLA